MRLPLTLLGIAALVVTPWAAFPMHASGSDSSRITTPHPARSTLTAPDGTPSKTREIAQPRSEVLETDGQAPSSHVLGLASGRDLNVRYAVPVSGDASAVRFRYRLAGFDTGWQDAGDRREASYAGLPDGDYRFEVASGNKDGEWSLPASFDIKVAARFFETTWFRVLAVLALFCLLYAAWRLRFRHVTNALRIRLDERGIVARDMHDTILQAAQAMAFRLDVMANCQREAPTREELASLADYARKTIEEGRKKLEVLRADHEDDIRPVSALVRLANELASQGGPTVTWTTEGKPRSFNPLVGAQIRSIGREMLFNAFMHARATRIQLRADYGKRRFALTVQDDGCGVDIDEATSKRGHYGLRGMQERTLRCGGCLRIGPLNPGTLATLTIPAPRAYTRTPFSFTA